MKISNFRLFLLIQDAFRGIPGVIFGWSTVEGEEDICAVCYNDERRKLDFSGDYTTINRFIADNNIGSNYTPITDWIDSVIIAALCD